MMAYYTDDQLALMGFSYIGKNVKISDKSSIYNADQIDIGDNSRIDDFCIISGRVSIGSFCHITPMCLVAGGVPGIFFADFCTLAYNVKIFSQSDDYSGETLCNSLIPSKYKNQKYSSVYIARHVIIGSSSTILPGVEITEGCAVGAMSLITKSTLPWGIYAGIPARRVKEREKGLLMLEEKFLRETKNDSL